MHVGDTVTLAADDDYAVLDPLLAWADVIRDNNRYPRSSAPVYVGASAQGTIAVTAGEPFPWAAATISATSTNGRPAQTWSFERGMAAAPAWTADGLRLVVSYSEAGGPLPAIVSIAADGARRTVGHGSAPAAAPDGTIYAAVQNRIVSIDGSGRESTVVYAPGATLDLPLPSPDGTRLVYAAARGNRVQLREVGRDGAGDRLLLSWDRDRMLYRWSRDGSRLFAIIGGDWDWQVWDIPVGAEAVQVIARGAAAITDLAVSPDGASLAFTAAPALDYPTNRRQLYIVNLNDRAVRSVDVPDTDLSQLAWLNADTILVVATAVAADRPWIVPTTSVVKRVRASDGSVEDAH